MKKLRYGLILVCLLVLISGCKDNSGLPELTKAINNMDDINSLAMDITADVAMKNDSYDMNLKITSSGEYYSDDENQVAHLTGTVSLLGMKEETEVYTTVKDGDIYTYTNDDGNWIYTKETPNVEKTNIQSEISSLIKTYKKAAKVKSDKEGYSKIILTIAKDEINKMLNSGIIDEAAMSGMTIDKDIDITIYLKDNYLRIIELDFSDYLTEKMQTQQTNASVISKITMELSKFNEIEKIDIPSEVLDKAIESKE